MIGLTLNNSDGMIGSLISAGIGVGSRIFGGIKASKAMRKVKANLEDERRANRDWFDRRYNEDATQRGDARRILSMTSESIKNRNKLLDGVAAVMGGTEESVAAAKAANNKIVSDAVSQIAAANQQRKDAIEGEYRRRDAQINSYMRGLMAAEQEDNENAQRWQKWERQLGIDRYNREKAEADAEHKMARDKEKDRQWRVRPWLKAFYGGLEYVPGYERYALTPYEEVKVFDVENFDKPHKDVLAWADMLANEGKVEVVADRAKNELKEIRNDWRREQKQIRKLGILLDAVREVQINREAEEYKKKHGMK